MSYPFHLLLWFIFYTISHNFFVLLSVANIRIFNRSWAISYTLSSKIPSKNFYQLLDLLRMMNYNNKR